MASITQDHTVVLVTGANQGLGFESVKKLAAEQQKYIVLLGSRNLHRGKEAASKISNLAQGTSVEPLELDISSDDSIAKAAKQVEEKYGRLDVLFNNAGISHTGGASFRENFDTVLSTNVTGPACVTEAFLPLLRKAAIPRLVFMSSGLGSVTDTLNPKTPYYGLGNNSAIKAYIVSKSADNMLGALYAVHLGQEGFKVNIIDPGYRATNLNGYAKEATDPADGAVQACRMIVDTDKNGPHATFSSMDKELPW